MADNSDILCTSAGLPNFSYLGQPVKHKELETVCNTLAYMMEYIPGNTYAADFMGRTIRSFSCLDEAETHLKTNALKVPGKCFAAIGANSSTSNTYMIVMHAEIKKDDNSRIYSFHTRTFSFHIESEANLFAIDNGEKLTAEQMIKKLAEEMQIHTVLVPPKEKGRPKQEVEHYRHSQREKEIVVLAKKLTDLTKSEATIKAKIAKLQTQSSTAKSEGKANKIKVKLEEQEKKLSVNHIKKYRVNYLITSKKLKNNLSEDEKRDIKNDLNNIGKKYLQSISNNEDAFYELVIKKVPNKTVSIISLGTPTTKESGQILYPTNERSEQTMCDIQGSYISERFAQLSIADGANLGTGPRKTAIFAVEEMNKKMADFLKDRKKVNLREIALQQAKEIVVISRKITNSEIDNQEIEGGCSVGTTLLTTTVVRRSNKEFIAITSTLGDCSLIGIDSNKQVKDMTPTEPDFSNNSSDPGGVLISQEELLVPLDLRNLASSVQLFSKGTTLALLTDGTTGNFEYESMGKQKVANRPMAENMQVVLKNAPSNQPDAICGTIEGYLEKITANQKISTQETGYSAMDKVSKKLIGKLDHAGKLFFQITE